MEGLCLRVKAFRTLALLIKRIKFYGGQLSETVLGVRSVLCDVVRRLQTVSCRGQLARERCTVKCLC